MTSSSRPYPNSFRPNQHSPTHAMWKTQLTFRLHSDSLRSSLSLSEALVRALCDLEQVRRARDPFSRGFPFELGSSTAVAADRAIVAVVRVLAVLAQRNATKKSESSGDPTDPTHVIDVRKILQELQWGTQRNTHIHSLYTKV